MMGVELVERREVMGPNAKGMIIKERDGPGDRVQDKFVVAALSDMKLNAASFILLQIILRIIQDYEDRSRVWQRRLFHTVNYAFEECRDICRLLVSGRITCLLHNT